MVTRKSTPRTPRAAKSNLASASAAGVRDKVKEVHLEDKANEEYYKYGISVIEDRAIFGDIDGCKPVIRRALWATHTLGLRHTSKADKSAKIVGETLASYHPHGDSACLRGDTLVPLLSGKNVTIKELSDNFAGKRWVLAYDELTHGLVPAIAHSWREAKVTRKMLRITMSSGESIEVTHDHPLLCLERGWLEAKDVLVGYDLAGGTFIPNDSYASVALNTGFRRPVHSLVGDHVIGGVEQGEVYHHVDEDTRNNRPSNLKVVSREEHAEIHGDYNTGLAVGRDRMFGKKNTKLRQAIRDKNSTLLKLHNENLWLLKAVKAIRRLIEDERDLTEANYESLRGPIYNLTHISTLAQNGISFKQLCDMAPTFKLDTTSAVGLTKLVRKVKPRSSAKPALCFAFGMPHSFFDQASRVLAQCLKKNELKNISWDSYRKVAKSMPSVSSNDHKLYHTQPELIQDKFQVDTVEHFAHKLPASVLNMVVEIEEVVLPTKETFYDFTVDTYENMIVLTSEGVRSGNFIVVHNCYGAIVTAAKSPLKMIDGEGNWGTMNDGPAAYRYTNMRLSKYSDLVFFDKFYLPTIAYVPNYDGSKKEPLILPSLLPNAILNGNFGIAPGVNTRSPSFSLASVISVLKEAVAAKKCTPEMCMKLVFTSKYGGKAVRVKSTIPEFLKFFKTGQGTVKFVSTCTEPNLKNEIRFDEFAPITSVERTLAAIDSIPGVQSTRDDSDKHDKHEVAYVVTFQRNCKGADLEAAIRKVKDQFSASWRFSVQVTERYVDEKGEGAARLKPMTIPGMIERWIAYRLELEQTACSYWIEKRQVEIDDLNLLRLAVKMRDFVIKALNEKEKLSDDQLASYIAKGLEITVVQANRILDLKIRQLRALEDAKLAQKIADLKAESKTYAGRRKNPRAYVLQHLEVLEKELLHKRTRKTEP